MEDITVKFEENVGIYQRILKENCEKLVTDREI